MSSKVVIRNQQRTWSHTTTLDDPIFSDILAPYVELKENVTEVVLSPTVSEVIEKVWGWWQRAASQLRTMKSGESSARIQHPYTSDIVKFTSVLNLPDEWMYFVYLGGGSKMSMEEKVHYYVALGKTLKSSHRLQLRLSYDSTSAHVMRSILKHVKMNHVDEVVRLIRGMQWNASVLYEISNRGDRTLLLMTDWQVLAYYLSESSIRDDQLTNTVNILLGRGDLSMPNLLSSLGSADFGNDQERMGRFYSLYTLLMKSVQYNPTHVSLADIGLGGPYPSSGALLFIARYHREAFDTEDFYRHFFDARQLSCAANLLCRKLGRVNLSVIQLVLEQAALSSNGVAKAKIKSLLAFVEYEVNKEPCQYSWPVI